MLAENQPLGTDSRYSSVCLITPILRDHFRFVGYPEVVQIATWGSVPTSRLVWSGSGLKSTWMENALLVEVPEQLACPRFNCNTNHRASCSPGWRTAAGEDRFP